MSFVGVDLHKRQFTVCFRESETRQCVQEFSNDENGINEFLNKVTFHDRIAVEATGLSRSFVKRVRGAVHSVTLVDTANYWIISHSNKKTDAKDARSLAHGLELGILPTARLRSDAATHLRVLLNTRQLLVRHRVRTVHMLHSLAAQAGVYTEKQRLLYQRYREEIANSPMVDCDRLAWDILCNQMDSAHAQILRLDKSIRDSSAQFDGHCALASIPWFGPITVAYLLSTIDGIENFRSPKALCSYLGIVPRVRKSDGRPSQSKIKRLKDGCITRVGHKDTRTALVLAVCHVMHANSSLLEFHQRIKARRGFRKARIATARKLLTMVYYILKEKKPILDFGAIQVSRPHDLVDALAQVPNP